MTHLELAKKVTKEHGIKGFRKLSLKRPTYVVGKQCQFINKFVALNLLESLSRKGFDIADYKTCVELANKGHLDTITITFS
ncbi:hypothetical protein [Vibrio vulnificus]|uniref:hypothetical protein n=1 Tax=Vibrio vulnificus TaxID=672 RepID=UPI001C9DC633|nr:hypothetical protein [Vibrio fluvialis]